jgi:hypothetical protein
VRSVVCDHQLIKPKAMKTLNVSVSVIRGVLLGTTLLFLLACDRQDEPLGKGDVEFHITDAPSDDASIQGVFVTVTDIKVDGKSISGFTAQTVDLKAYSEGTTKLLSKVQLDAKPYSNLTLVLNTDVDAFGNTPGCYVFTKDGARYKLRNNGSVEVVLNKNWNVLANTTSTIVVDVDLRRAIRSMADVAIRYNFVDNDDLGAAIRLVNKKETGAINGSYANQSTSNGDKVIVYAYKKGTFTAAQETQTQGEDGLLFKMR